MAKSITSSIFDDKYILNEAIEQFQSLFIEAQQIIIFRQLSKIPQYLSKLEYFNQQYAEIYQHKSDISSSIMHFHNFNDAIKNLYLPQLYDQVNVLNIIDNFIVLFKQAQDIITNKKFDLAEQYLTQVQILKEQHGDLIKYILNTNDPMSLKSFYDFTDFIEKYSSSLTQHSNDNSMPTIDQFVNDIAPNLKEKIIMIEGKGLYKLTKLPSINPLELSLNTENSQVKIDHIELVSERLENKQTIINNNISSNTANLDTTNNISLSNTTTHPVEHAFTLTEPQVLDTSSDNSQVIIQTTVGNKLHIVKELDVENCVDWFIEPEKLDSPIVNESHINNDCPLQEQNHEIETTNCPLNTPQSNNDITYSEPDIHILDANFISNITTQPIGNSEEGIACCYTITGTEVNILAETNN